MREEKKERKRLEEELKDLLEELDETRNESDEEKALLLQRIKVNFPKQQRNSPLTHTLHTYWTHISTPNLTVKDLEEDLEQLRELMETSLTAAGREKAEALRKATEAREHALDEAEVISALSIPWFKHEHSL